MNHPTASMLRRFSGTSFACILAALATHCGAYGQQIYNNPVVEAIKSEIPLHVDQVILTDTGTSLVVTAKYIPSSRINLPLKQSYISIEGDTTKYFIQSTTGAEQIDFTKRNTPNGTRQITMNFPLVIKGDKQHAKLNFGEFLFNGRKVYGIDYRWENKAFPKSLLGNWYDRSTGRLAFVITPDRILHDARMATIEGGNQEAGTIELSEAGLSKTFYYQSKDGEQVLGFQSSQLSSYTQGLSLCQVRPSKQGYDNYPYQKGSSRIRGYIEGFNQLGLSKSIRFLVRDPLLDKQVTRLAEIAADGSFDIQLPVYGPTQPILSSEYLTKTLYVEPGKDLFVVIKGAEEPLFMGELAALNDDMRYIYQRIKINTGNFRAGIGLKDPMTLQNSLLAQKDSAFVKLNALYREGKVSKKAYQTAQANIKYLTAYTILQHESQYDQYYRLNHKLAVNAQVPPHKVPDQFYSFLNNGYLDDLDILGYSNSNLFLSALKYRSPWFQKTSRSRFQEIFEYLESKGTKFSQQEKEAILKTPPKSDTADWNAHLVARQQFFDKYIYEANTVFRKNYRDSAMAANGLHTALVSELYFVQDFSDIVYKQLSPLKADALKRMQYEIKNPFFRSWMAALNAEVTAQLALGNKTIVSSGSAVDQRASKIFERLMRNAKGSVVLVDFWELNSRASTESIRRIAAIKKQLAGKQVKFVHITNDKAPLSIWKQNVPYVPGENFRVTTNEWNYLLTKFQFSAVPNAVILDKNGDIAETNLSTVDTDRLQKKLEHYL